jgi:hypothetical protein
VEKRKISLVPLQLPMIETLLLKRRTHSVVTILPELFKTVGIFCKKNSNICNIELHYSHQYIYCFLLYVIYTRRVHRSAVLQYSSDAILLAVGVPSQSYGNVKSSHKYVYLIVIDAVTSLLVSRLNYVTNRLKISFVSY